MRKLLASLFGSGRPPEPPAPPPEFVDTKAIRFSIPTLSEDAAPLAPLEREPGPGTLLFHEDDWRQVEFVAAGRLSEVQHVLAEYKPFEEAHRVSMGWNEIYLRRFDPTTIVAGLDAVHQVEQGLGVTAGPAPVLFTMQSLEGRVRDGFTLPLGRNVDLYGYTTPEGIPVLGANLGPEPEDIRLTEAFARLHAAHGLVLVDWRAQLILTGVDADGQISVWTP